MNFLTKIKTTTTTTTSVSVGQPALRPHRGFASRRLRRGVTLIETLASLAVLAAVAPVLGRCWVLTVTRSAMVADELTAASLAEAQLLEIVSGSADTSENSGDFSPEYPDFKWELDSSSWDQDDSFEQLDLKVYWLHGPEQRSLTLTTIQAVETQ